jgi:hypothetical protein
MRTFFALWLGWFLLFTSPIQAQQNQDDTWLAWLYNANAGDIVQIDGDGFIRLQGQIELPFGYEFYPFDLAVSRSGERIAYVAYPREGRAVFFVYDPRAGQRDIRLEYPLPDIIADSIGFVNDDTYAYHPADTSFALGYSLRGGGWELPIIDLETGLVTFILRSGFDVGTDLPADAGITPVIRAYDGQSVIFSLVQSSAPNQAEGDYGTYVWDTLGRSVSDFASLAVNADVYAPTGDVVMVQPQGDDQRGGLYVYDALEDQRFPFDARAVLPDDVVSYTVPRFARQGEVIVFATYGEAGTADYHVIGRDGVERPTWQTLDGQQASSLRGTAEGFAYTLDTVDGDGTSNTTLYNVDLTQTLLEDEALLTTPIGQRMRIVWLRDDRLRALPYAPWARLENTLQPAPTPQPILADMSAWQAWVYQDDGRVVRLQDDGTVLADITLPAGHQPSRITSDDDGALLVYFADEALHIYDVRRDALLMSYVPRDERTPNSTMPSIIGETIGRAPEHNLFDPDKTRLAFGYSTPDGWYVDVIAPATGERIAQLRPDSPAMQGILTLNKAGVVPIIQRVTANQVAFTLQKAGAYAPPDVTFVWDTQTDLVNPSLLYVAPYSETFALTGEVLMSLQDARLPDSRDRFLYGHVNTLHVYNPTTNTRYPFFHDERRWLLRPEFVQNGEAILVGARDDDGQLWRVVRRDGQVVADVVLDDVVATMGTGNGFVYIPRDDSNLALWHINTRDAPLGEPLTQGANIWQTTLTGRPQLVWVGYAPYPVAYEPWQTLAPPVDVGSASNLNTGVTQLTAGTTAFIRTMGASALYLRTGAGRNFDVVTRLRDGTRVTLVRGADLSADGLRWWYVRTPSGLTGWVVAESDGIKTLVPSDE